MLVILITLQELRNCELFILPLLNIIKTMAALSCLAQVFGQGGGGGGSGGRGGGGGGGARNSVFYQTIVKTQKALSASASSQLK
jgi:hypothetical protein